MSTNPSFVIGGPGGRINVLVPPPEGQPPDVAHIEIQLADPKLAKVTLTRRKTNLGTTVQLTVNCDTVVSVNGAIVK